MEDEHRLVEKVDLSLDNRQIFLFFVASAVLISMVFALGVVVGKRMVASGAEQRAPTDPLALLDQIGTNEPGDDQLTFHSALTRDNAEKKKTSKPAKPSAPKKADPVASAPPLPQEQPAKPAAKKKLAEKPERKPLLASKPAEKKAAGKKATKGEQKRNDAADTYTLQLSSFQDRGEAERFMQKLKDAGLSPHIIAARIPDRGVWYRVRLGSYTSWDEALAAKTRFESTQKVIAYVAKR